MICHVESIVGFICVDREYLPTRNKKKKNKK